MKRIAGLALAAGLAFATSAVAQPQGQQEDNGQGAMLLATLVGGYSPTVSAAHKLVLTHYLAGVARTDARAGTVTVDVSQVSCTAGDKDETSFACDLRFGATPVHLTARAASQVYAALQLVAADLSAPIGTYGVTITALHCTLDAATIAKGISGGADCTFTPTTAGGASPSGQPPAAISVDDDSSLLLAALVGGLSPTVSAPGKAVLAHYLAGQPTLDAAAAKIPVSVDEIGCRSSNRTETSWSCALKFGAATVNLTGRAASELYAALGLAGAQGDAAMGKFLIGAKPLRCTVDPAAIATHNGGAPCTLTYDNTAVP